MHVNAVFASDDEGPGQAESARESEREKALEVKMQLLTKEKRFLEQEAARQKHDLMRLRSVLLQVCCRIPRG